MRASAVLICLLALPSLLLSAAARVDADARRVLAPTPARPPAPAPPPLGAAFEPMRSYAADHFALPRELLSIKSLTRFYPSVGDLLVAARKQTELCAAVLEDRVGAAVAKLAHVFVAPPAGGPPPQPPNREEMEQARRITDDALAPVYEVPLVVRGSSVLLHPPQPAAPAAFLLPRLSRLARPPPPPSLLCRLAWHYLQPWVRSPCLVAAAKALTCISRMASQPHGCASRRQRQTSTSCGWWWRWKTPLLGSRTAAPRWQRGSSLERCQLFRRTCKRRSLKCSSWPRL